MEEALDQKAQGDPGKPRETKGSPRRPREAQEGPGTRKPQGAPGRPRDSHRDPRFPQVLVGLLYYLGASGATIAMPWRRLSPWLPSIATCNRAIDPPETRLAPPSSWHIHPITAPPFSKINTKTIGQGGVPLHPTFNPSNLIHNRWLDTWKHVCKYLPENEICAKSIQHLSLQKPMQCWTILTIL